MSDIFNEDFQDFIKILNDHNVEYLLVGGYAVIIHGYRRSTGDMDIWVSATSENYVRLFNAFQDFGMQVFDMTEERFLKTNEVDVFTFGRPPVSIDIITNLKGLNFSEAYKLSSEFIENNLRIKVIHKNQLLIAKEAAGRYKDLDDLEKLRSQD